MKQNQTYDLIKFLSLFYISITYLIDNYYAFENKTTEKIEFLKGDNEIRCDSRKAELDFLCEKLKSDLITEKYYK